MTLSQENTVKVGNLFNNTNYINFGKNYYSNPIVRKKNNKNFQELLKINTVLKIVNSNPELIDKGWLLKWVILCLRHLPMEINKKEIRQKKSKATINEKKMILIINNHYIN